MPKSKRNKVATLSKATSKGKAGKKNLIDKIHKSLQEYKYVYVFSFHNMRTNLLKEVRSKWSSSRFFLGKNKVMQIAFGRQVEDELQPNLHKISKNVVGNCALFFTNEKEEEVLKFFNAYSEADFARSGAEATETIVLNQGPLDKYFVHSQEPFLRNTLGLPTSLKNGVVYLEKDHTVCKEGEPLTPEQAKLLKLIGVKMANFHFTLVCVWSGGKFKQF